MQVKHRILASDRCAGAHSQKRNMPEAMYDRALTGYERVIEVDYDPSKNPTRMAMQYPTVGADMRPLPPKRTEV